MKRERPGASDPDPAKPGRFRALPTRLKVSKAPANFRPSASGPRTVPPPARKPSSFTVKNVHRGKEAKSALADQLLVRAKVAVGSLGPQLNQQQRHVSGMVHAGKSVFFTGCAGTGKSFLVRYLIAALRCKYGVRSVAVVASTGIAAVQIGGGTLHKWAGVGKGDGTQQQLLGRVRSNRDAMERWQTTRCILIDEISMLSGELFSALSWVGSNIRRNNRPFGGIQVVCTGDFLQLPPVSFTLHAFQTSDWAQMFPADQCVLLQRVYRQTDATFQRTLSSIRNGTITDKELAALNAACCRPFSTRDGIVSTKLFCHNAAVDDLNLRHLQQLPSESYVFESLDRVDDFRTNTSHAPSPVELQQLSKLTRAAQRLELKADAQVMLLSNLDADRGLVNGSRGVVVGFVRRETVTDRTVAGDSRFLACNKYTVPLVRFSHMGLPVQVEPRGFSSETQTELMSRTQIPLMLCWAITVHKAQGLTLDRCSVDLSHAFAEGQVYTALSRARSPQGLSLQSPLQRDNIRVSEDVVKFYESLK